MDPQQQSQAGADPAKAEPAGSDGKAAAKLSRTKEFMASLTDAADVKEFRQTVRDLSEPDFKAADQKAQKRFAAERKRAEDAERALADLSNPDVVARYQEEQGTLAKAKERATKTGKLPAWAARNVRSFDDLWEAEDDFAKNGAAKSAGAEAEPDDEDAAFVARLKRAGVQVQATTAAAAANNVARARPGGGASIGEPTLDDLVKKDLRYMNKAEIAEHDKKLNAAIRAANR